MLLTNAQLQLDHLIDHSDYHYKMFIRSLVLVLFQLVELRLVFLSQELLPNLLHLELRLKLSLLSNIILNLRLLIQEIMLVSTSKVLLLKIFLEVQLLLTLNKTLLKLVIISLLRLSL